jgi:exopolyphosphatase/guanosine-5'-triphosphate,3'-diphosphate pyrophosphatase
MIRLIRESVIEEQTARKIVGGGVREKTLGVVDIGSNTVHLLVARTNGRSVTPLVDMSEGLRLGGDVDYAGALSPEKLDALIVTLRGFQSAAASVGVNDLHLLATQALRTAMNRDQVLAAVEAALGLPVEVLPTDVEAEYSFLGADTICPSVGPQVVVDIGGGSMQVSVGQNGQVWDSVSLPLGASRVSTRFLPSDPPTYIEEALLVTYLANTLPPALPLPDTNVSGVLGVGGTLRRTPPMIGLELGETFPHNALETMLAQVRGKTAEEIADLYNQKPERARLIMPALLLMREVLRGYDFPPLIMAAYGIREGAIMSLARRGREA